MNPSTHPGSKSVRPAENVAPATDDALDGLTIRIPRQPDEERVVRPALAVLYRIALGPAADRYAPRFLEYERLGWVLPGWHWPSFIAPSVWAFYRKLYVPGFVFAALPLVGAAAFSVIGPRVEDSAIMWFACAALLVWLLPGIIPAILAQPLLYWRIRRVVRNAEAGAAGTSEAASRLKASRPTSTAAALLLGSAVVACAFGGSAPALYAAHAERLVRAKVAAGIAAVQGLQRQLEATWLRTPDANGSEDEIPALAQARGNLIADVDVNKSSGRVRVDLGPSIPELAGKAILLVPALDLRHHIQWLCIPIDIPIQYLPRECRDR